MLLEGDGWFGYRCSIQHDGGLEWEHSHTFQIHLKEQKLLDTDGRKLQEILVRSSLGSPKLVLSQELA